MLVAAYRAHGETILFDPPKVTPDFRIEVAKWALTNNASYTQVAAKFGYLGMFQIMQWKKSIAKRGQMGYCLSQKDGSPK